jgi:hypothetical protein
MFLQKAILKSEANINLFLIGTINFFGKVIFVRWNLIVYKFIQICGISGVEEGVFAHMEASCLTEKMPVLTQMVS